MRSMWHYRRRRRRRWRSSYDFELSSKRRVSSLYGGIDADVRTMMFSLDKFTLRLLFEKYEQLHGSGKRKYAEATFEKWRTGAVEMGGEISERFIKLVPPFLSFEQKYMLIEKLWARLRQQRHVQVTISAQESIIQSLETVHDALETADDLELPESLRERLLWLSDDDGKAATGLLERVLEVETQNRATFLNKELHQLMLVARQNGDKNVSASKKIELPGITLTIAVSQGPIARRPTRMAQSPIEPGNEEGKGGHELAPIKNPNDLLTEAIQRMPAKKQQEIISKATDEALRLQVKKKEGEIDSEMARKKVDDAATFAARSTQKGVNFTYETEHVSEHGRTTLKIDNKPQYGCSAQTILLALGAIIVLYLLTSNNKSAQPGGSPSPETRRRSSSR